MPAEFEPHAGCWLLWPERPDVWPERAKFAQSAFAQVATAIARFESVTVGVSRTQYQNARAMLPSNIRVIELSADDAWLRDSGPTFVKNAQGLLRGVHWEFNAWGGAYSNWEQDRLVAQKILDLEHIDRYKADFVLEGGSIHVDGEGTLITTSQCLLNPNRNPRLSQSEIEDHLKAYLNVEKVIWLNRGVYNDETSGHVDNLCCFVRPGVVALTWTDDSRDPQYEISTEAYEQLSRETDAKGRQLEIHRIHQPGPLHTTEAESKSIEFVEGTLFRPPGTRLPASYINFYIANGGIIVPTFNDPHDSEALKTLQYLFPEREIIGIYARDILLGGGNIHCITQQQPTGGHHPH